MHMEQMGFPKPTPENYARDYFKTDKAKNLFDNPNRDAIIEQLKVSSKALEVPLTHEDIAFNGTEGNEVIEGEGWKISFAWEQLSSIFSQLNEDQKARLSNALLFKENSEENQRKMSEYVYIKEYSIRAGEGETVIVPKNETGTISLWSLQKNFKSETFNASQNIVLSSPTRTLPELMGYTHELGHAEYFSSASEKEQQRLIKDRKVFLAAGMVTNLTAPEYAPVLDTILYDEHVAWDKALDVVNPLLKNMNFTEEQIEAYIFTVGKSNYEYPIHWVVSDD